MMTPEHQDIAVTLLPGVKVSDRRSMEQGSMTAQWDMLRGQLFREHIVTNDKTSTMCFTPCVWLPLDECEVSKKDGRSMRLDENVTMVTMAVVDADAPGAYEKTINALGHYEHVAYSTYSYSREKQHKMRVVFPLRAPASNELWHQELHPRLMGMTDGDTQCCNPSRLYFLPSHPTNINVPPLLLHKRGAFLSIEEMMQWPYPEETEQRRRRRVGLIDPAFDLSSIGDKGAASGAPSPSEILFKSEGGTLYYDWNAMITRHADLVEDLRREDSRHEFAMRVIARELSRMREDAHVGFTTGFIARIARNIGSRALEDGNTLDELPDLFDSAASKYCPGLQLTQREIHKGIAWGLQASHCEVWPGDPAPAVVESPWGPEWRYAAIQMRNAKPLQIFQCGGSDPAAFATAIVNAEWNRHGGGEFPATPTLMFILHAAVTQMASDSHTQADAEHCVMACGSGVAHAFEEFKPDAACLQRWRDAWMNAVRLVGCGDMLAETPPAAVVSASHQQTGQGAPQTAECPAS